MFALNTVLFATLAFKECDITEDIIYNKLLNDKLSTNLGYAYENIIAQMLKTTGKICSIIQLYNVIFEIIVLELIIPQYIS